LALGVCLAVTLAGIANALLFTVCTPYENQQCARVQDAVVTFYLRNHTKSAGAQFYETTLRLASVVMGEPSRPKILQWTDCRSIANTTNPVYNETMFSCRALVRAVVPPSEGLGLRRRSWRVVRLRHPPEAVGWGTALGCTKESRGNPVAGTVPQCKCPPP
jgi:hypothetical protein